MRYLIDTNVISELVKPQPQLSVLEFLHQVDEDRVFLSVVTLSELRRGIALKPESHKKSALDLWLRKDLMDRFEGRILDITPPIADAWGELMAKATLKGLHLHVIDGYLAASAQVHNLILVTRNVKDFSFLDLQILNPWQNA